MAYDADITIRTDSGVKRETQEIFDALNGNEFNGPFYSVEELMKDLDD